MYTLKDLYNRGVTGLDLSPGDPLCYWAHGEIVRLEKELNNMRSVNRYHRGHTEGYKEAEEKFKAQIVELEDECSVSRLRNNHLL